jgi:hypothetical protein
MTQIPLTEQQLVTYCINYINAKGHFVWRNNSGVTHNTYTNKAGVTHDRMWRAGVKGGSDILGIAKDGRFIAVECKVGKNKATPIQLAFLDEIKRRGGHAYIVYTQQEIEAIL